ncbi:MAG TPA: NAD(P)H-hydrate dehydratase, partial [Flavitalea sp.]|nr:NAD(P)H-hydrate dehydratase [Flavitalea sp.]
SIGIGPGLGTDARGKQILEKIFDEYNRPIILDADALNLISNYSQLLSHVPVESVITPHPKEFERLFGTTMNDFERIERAKEEAKKWKIVIVLKGHHTCIINESSCYINFTGNVGMAKGGSGDVLTGILTALLAQGYPSMEAALLGVFLHGRAADLALEHSAFESMLASDIISHLAPAFRSLY